MKKIVIFTCFVSVFFLQINGAKQAVNQERNSKNSIPIEGLEDIFGNEESSNELKSFQVGEALKNNVSSEPKSKVKIIIEKIGNKLMGLLVACGDFFKSFNN